jgi:hypothetical protein
MSINQKLNIILSVSLVLILFCNKNETNEQSSSKNTQDTSHNYNYVKSIPVPEGFERVTPDSNSFGYYLQNLEMRKEDNTVYLFNGEKKVNQNAHFVVVSLDVGSKDLQQCADVIMRLRAEYLFKQNRFSDIHFNFVSGFNCEWVKYADGYRVAVKGNSVKWVKSAEPDYTNKNFRNYLELVFTYAGTASLIKELNKVDNIGDIQIGDIFIQTGNPYGHAVIVLDAAINKSSGKKVFMLGQSYMPAQDFHILKNPNDDVISPWYELSDGEELITPEWTFQSSDLKRFP